LLSLLVYAAHAFNSPRIVIVVLVRAPAVEDESELEGADGRWVVDVVSIVGLGRCLLGASS
ncbi:MAG TPA: hypothetical protein VIL55_06345, partial [Naasia sp.]